MIDSHIISALGWTLIHFLWQGSAIVMTYWLISRSSKSLHAKYWTGMVAVALCLLIPISQFFSLIKTPEVVQGTFLVSSTYHSMALTPLSAWETMIMLVNQSLPYLVLVWALAVLAMTSSLIRSWFKLNAIEHDCDAPLSAELKQFIKNAAIRLDLATIPVLKVSTKILVPAAYGIYKPTVLLPLSLLSQIPKEQLHAIITHELCHLKRNDFLHNILQITADILLFFNPFIRWMNNDIRQVREQCCDQLVLSQNTHAVTYAKALTNIASLSNGHSFGPRLQIGINDGLLLKRVKFLLQNNSSQSSVMMFIPLALLLLACFYMFQSNLEPISFNASTVSNNFKSSSKLKKRMVSPLFYPQAQQAAEQQTFTPAATDTTRPSKSYNAAPQTPVDMPSTMTDFNVNHFLNDVKPEVNKVDLREELSGSFDQALTRINPDNSLVDTVITQTTDTNNKQSILSTSSLIEPKLETYVAPDYPQTFWLKQVEQTVIASFKIKPNGRLTDVQLKSTGNNHAAFELSVKSTLKKWRFAPNSLTTSSRQKTYQRIFAFTISDESKKNCKNITTGSRIKKSSFCRK